MPVNLFLPQVTRIPITGPDPFNTLVCVSAEKHMGPQEVAVGKLSSYPLRVPTPFRLVGFDQRVPPTFKHSTTAWLSSIGPAEDDRWLYAVDSVMSAEDSVTGAGFNPLDGNYFVDLMVSILPGDPVPETCVAFPGGAGVCFYFAVVQVTSYVLCIEPPLPHAPQGRGQTGVMGSRIKLQKPHSLVELVSERLGIPVALAANATEATRSTSCSCLKVKKQ